jgi:2-isopropylmalate synthase
MTPESVGVPTNTLVLGKHSGRHALSLRFAELGFVLLPQELETAYHRFTALADRKKTIYDQDLVSLLNTDGAESLTTGTIADSHSGETVASVG